MQYPANLRKLVQSIPGKDQSKADRLREGIAPGRPAARLEHFPAKWPAVRRRKRDPTRTLGQVSILCNRNLLQGFVPL
jgi:hypothetical protein